MWSNPQLCLTGCRQHSHPPVAATGTAGPPEGSAEDRQHRRQETGAPRGEPHAHTPEVLLKLRLALILPSCPAQAAQKAQAVLEKNGRKVVLVDSVEAESLSVRKARTGPASLRWSFILKTQQTVSESFSTRFRTEFRTGFTARFRTVFTPSLSAPGSDPAAQNWGPCGPTSDPVLVCLPGSDEDGEPVELGGAAQSCYAARSPRLFWEGPVCLSGSEGSPAPFADTRVTLLLIGQ